MSQTHETFNNIIDLLPSLSNEELLGLISEIKRLQEVRLKPKSALQQQINFKKPPICPHCGSSMVVKNGTRKKTHVQQYICPNCGNSVSPIPPSIFLSTKKHLTYWNQYVTLMNFELSLKQIAIELKINVKTAFLWRHKIMAAIENFDLNIKLSNTIWLDEYYMRLNNKGNKNIANPRHHGKDPVGDVVNNTVIVIVAIDDNDNILTIPAGTGKILSQDTALRLLQDRIVEGSTIITDETRAYNKLISKLKLKRIAYKSTDHSEKTILEQSNMNNLCSNIEDFFANFHGVSTKYLSQYLALFRFNKKLSYTTEETRNKILIYFDKIIDSKVKYKFNDLATDRLPWE